MNFIDENKTDNFVNDIQNINYNPEIESEYDSSDDKMVASLASNTLQIEPKNRTLQIGKTKVGLLIDSGCVFSILNESFSTETINNAYPARWLTTALSKDLRTFAK